MKILETTLRDGSYGIDFGFTSRDTSDLCSALERAGFDLIEIGHGIGLGASEKGLGKAAQTDEEYLAAAAGSLKTAKFGMFCIPGIAKLEHVDLCAKYGMGFIRIGTNASEAELAEPFIRRAKQSGMYVCVNFMKSYALPPIEFASKVQIAEDYGADIVYVVDSSGGMLPNEVEAYFGAIRDLTSVPLGFHAHENLGLGMANTLKAIEMGAEIVDSSLQGMGRSAGNPPTEMLVAVLRRMGHLKGIDPIEVMDISERYIRPRITRQGHSSMDVTSGMAQFHSSYMNTVLRSASHHNVDPRRLIVALCEVDKINAPAELVDRIAANLDKIDTLKQLSGFGPYFGNEQSNMKS